MKHHLEHKQMLEQRECWNLEMLIPEHHLFEHVQLPEQHFLEQQRM
uniref:Uncharacterized protein n=1 Tax=Picea glauca TaxID=3330 RepID=A0A124GNZ2_PICGL|nr:hypothetical protein ABT39_MTgene136 [Picea glauca]KUM50304.1 hypothetical protein ABT39_MTgene147 [Picea glauca]KUM50317.1 hypothetical protein ABT39_MTgene160 [Picea glauca]